MFKKLTLLVALIGMATIGFAQNDVSTIKLAQTNGEFNVKGLTISEGVYQFEIENTDVAHPVGFVLAPAGHPEEASHIKDAYVKETVKKGMTSKTNEVTLKKGEYIYFCPLNPTPQYTLTVE